MKSNNHNYLFHCISFCLFVIVIVLLYANTFQSPYIFDDSQNILNNYLIKITALSLEDLKKAATFSPNMRRALPNMSFALNYYFDGSNVWGYHLGNIIIHVLTAFFFYLLAQATLNLPSMKKHIQRPAEIALIAALVWAVHPLQTNGVTYIVQRMTSMASLFYIIALFCYLKARITNKVIQKTLLFSGTIIFGVMALFSKENSGMLPVMIAGYEIFFLQGPSRLQDRKKILMILSGALVIFLFICLFMLGTHPLDSILGGYGGRDFTLGERLLTQTRIIFHYLTLLVLPLPSRLNLAYDYQLSTGLLAPPQTMLAIVGIAGLIFLIFFLFKRNRLTSFAIFWFLVNLAVESTFIPLELIFEHRMYLPSMFLILAGIAWVYRLFSTRINTSRMTLFILIALLSLFTWQRNGVWKNEITLWSDVVEKSPVSLRGHGNLGLAYANSKQYERAEQYLLKAIAIGQDDKNSNFASPTRIKYLSMAHDNLGMVYRELRNYPKALSEAQHALELDPLRPDPLITIGIVHTRMNNHGMAYEFFQKAAGLGLNTVDLYNNWAVSSFNLGKTDQAIRLLRQALAMDPEHPESHYNLGIAYSSLGMLEEAQQEMSLAMKFRNRR